MSTLTSSPTRMLSAQFWLFMVGLTSLCSLGCHDRSQVNTGKSTQEPTAVRFKLNTWREQLAEVKKIQKALDDASDPISSREIRYQALRELELLASSLPTIAPILELKRAEIWASLGRWRQSMQIVNTLSIDDVEIQRIAGQVLITYASKCEQFEEGIELLSQQQSDRGLERIIARAQVKFTAQCKPPHTHRKALLKLAEIDPHQLSIDELIEISSRESPEEVIRLVQVWERLRLPQASILALKLLLTREGLSKRIRWEARFQRERISIERVREGYQRSARQLMELIKVSGEPGRRARLLLGKAWSKAGKAKKAQRVYRELIQEWKFSEESKKARFRSSFLHYEQGQYRDALKGFAELCRHKGKLKMLNRFPDRAVNRLIAQAEWYYAWNLYLTKSRHAAPFLEALIGRGLPTSEEGRRAAYWASKALSRDEPERAAQYRAQLLAGHWGDWYTLLLRAEDPELSADIKPWPTLPEFNPPVRLPLLTASQRTDLTSPQARSLPVRVVNDQPALIESLAARIEIAQELRLSQLSKTYHQRARAEFRAQLRSLQEIEPDLIFWGQSLSFHRELLRWALSHSLKRRKSPPQINEGSWWMLLYPRAFSDAVQTASMEASVAQVKLLSFIYKESAFDASAVSPAYAMGLMQLLEKTARALHPKAPSPNLMDPRENVQLGAEYLALLSNRFHDQLPLVAAAYNAGPNNVISWLERSIQTNERKLDRFVELIPFKEARNYVKRLIGLYCTYALLYDQLSINRCAASLPLTLNMNVEPGVSF